jgi:hypothetical protein
VDRGDRTADDHLNAAVARDGTLYVATKNSVDRVGCPQLVLRVRSPQGRWRNYPYALRTAEWQPSRPIVCWGAIRRASCSSTPLSHGPARAAQSVIGWQVSDPTRLDLSAAARTLIDAGTHVNNVTGSKARLPLGQPWIVLAPTRKGRSTRRA